MNVVKNTSTTKPKPIIAIDIDDVLCEFVPAFSIFARDKWDENVTLDNFTEEWYKIFKANDAETIKARITQMFNDLDFYKDMDIIRGAKTVLRKLKQNFTLVPMTSRAISVQEITLDWLNRNFGNIFAEIVFNGAYEPGNDFYQTVHKTKGNICREIGATYLIDDQPKHANSFAMVGGKSVLFGDYGWNRNAEIVEGVTRVVDWGGVADYFGV